MGLTINNGSRFQSAEPELGSILIAGSRNYFSVLMLLGVLEWCSCFGLCGLIITLTNAHEYAY